MARDAYGNTTLLLHDEARDGVRRERRRLCIFSALGCSPQSSRLRPQPQSRERRRVECRHQSDSCGVGGVARDFPCVSHVTTHPGHERIVTENLVLATRWVHSRLSSTATCTRIATCPRHLTHTQLVAVSEVSHVTPRVCLMSQHPWVVSERSRNVAHSPRGRDSRPRLRP